MKKKNWVFQKKIWVFSKKVGFFGNIWCFGPIIGGGTPTDNELDDFTYGELYIYSKVAVYGNIMDVYVVQGCCFDSFLYFCVCVFLNLYL